MPTATECIYNNERIDIVHALEVKESVRGGRLETAEFNCIECAERVRPHRGGGHMAAHFEHLQRNPNCSLSHRIRHVALVTDYELDDPKAIEGYLADLRLTTLARNAAIVAKCKQRDDFTCQACDFRLTVNGQHVIECHHKVPLAVNGEREVSLSELVCLCPTCHRIAHTRDAPFEPEEIRVLLKLT